MVKHTHAYFLKQDARSLGLSLGLVGFLLELRDGKRYERGHEATQ